MGIFQRIADLFKMLFSGFVTSAEDNVPLERRLAYDRLKRAENENPRGSLSRKGLTMIPTRIYFKGPRAKVELALARGKEGRDRRREIAARDVRRDVEREFKGRYRD